MWTEERRRWQAILSTSLDVRNKQGSSIGLQWYLYCSFWLPFVWLACFLVSIPALIDNAASSSYDGAGAFSWLYHCDVSSGTSQTIYLSSRMLSFCIFGFFIWRLGRYLDSEQVPQLKGDELLFGDRSCFVDNSDLVHQDHQETYQSNQINHSDRKGHVENDIEDSMEVKAENNSSISDVSENPFRVWENDVSSNFNKQTIPPFSWRQTIFVRRIPRKCIDPHHLEAHFSKWGPVRTATIILGSDELEAAIARLYDIRRQILSQTKSINSDDNDDLTNNDLDDNQVSDGLMTLVNDLNRTLMSLESTRKVGSGSAFVTFFQERDAIQCLGDHAISAFAYFLCSHVCCWFYRAPRFLGSYHLQVVPAPHPLDIMWFNLHYSWCRKFGRRVFTLLVAGGITVATLFSSISLRFGGSLLTAGLLVVINFVAEFTLSRLAHMERHKTHSARISSLLFKTVSLQLVTTIILMFVRYDLSLYHCEWLEVAAEVVFINSTFRMIVHPLLERFRFGDALSYAYATFRGKLDQRGKTPWEELPPYTINLNARYCSLLFVINLTLAFGPTIPFLFLLSFIGGIFHFLIDKYNLFYVYTLHHVDISVPRTAHMLMVLAMILQGTTAFITRRDEGRGTIFGVLTGITCTYLLYRQCSKAFTKYCTPQELLPKSMYSNSTTINCDDISLEEKQLESIDTTSGHVNNSARTFCSNLQDNLSIVHPMTGLFPMPPLQTATHSPQHQDSNLRGSENKATSNNFEHGSTNEDSTCEKKDINFNSIGNETKSDASHKFSQTEQEQACSVARLRQYAQRRLEMAMNWVSPDAPSHSVYFPPSRYLATSWTYHRTRDSDQRSSLPVQ